MSLNDQQRVSDLAKHSIRYSVAFTHALGGSVVAGIMLSQLLYWNDKGHRHDRFFYKTVEELYIETGLKKDQQLTAIRVLKKYDLIELKLAGIPAKRHFQVNVEKVMNLITTWLENDSEDVRKIINQLYGKRTTITKTTTKLRTTPHESNNTIKGLPSIKNTIQSHNVLDDIIEI